MKILKILFIVLFLLCVSPHTLYALTVTVDAGHGGHDQGAVRGSLKESEIVLNLARKVQNKLTEQNQFNIVMTRNENKFLSLSDRVKKAHQNDADLFISLHANAAPDSKAKGLEFFFQNSLAADEESQYLAVIENQVSADEAESKNEISKKGDIKTIVEDLKRQARLKESLRLTQSLQYSWKKSESKQSTSIKQAPLYVLSRTQMPSVLIEIGFLSHPQEAKMIASEKHQDFIADKIVEAVLEYRKAARKQSQKNQLQ